MDCWPLRRPGTETSSTWVRLALEKVPLLALSAVSGVITIVAQQAGGSVRTVAEVSLPIRQDAQVGKRWSRGSQIEHVQNGCDQFERGEEAF